MAGFEISIGKSKGDKSIVTFMKESKDNFSCAGGAMPIGDNMNSIVSDGYRIVHISLLKHLASLVGVSSFYTKGNMVEKFKEVLTAINNYKG
jgi:hypothetical protein